MTSRENKMYGKVSLRHTYGSVFSTAFAFLVACGIVFFICFGGFTRKARVTGLTVPAMGTIGILSPSPGVLAKAYVAENGFVRAGAPLFELSTAREGKSGEITSLVGKQLVIQRATYLRERETKLAQALERRRFYSSQLASYDAQLGQADQEIALTKQRQVIAEALKEQYQMLQKQGFASGAQLNEKQSQAIEISAQLSSLSRTRIQLSSSRLGLKSESEDLERNLTTEIARLDRSIAELDQAQLENSGRSTLLIVAPETGRVTSITYKQGQAIVSGQPLANMIPSQTGETTSDLEVHLFAPSRTAGFIVPNQSVLIRYQAFPYQKFGLYPGKVIDVSATPFAPNELPLNVASTVLAGARQKNGNDTAAEALYRIRVHLKSQSVNAYGSAIQLKPGMTVDADIVQERRAIWEWILDPVFALGR